MARAAMAHGLNPFDLSLSKGFLPEAGDGGFDKLSPNGGRPIRRGAECAWRRSARTGGDRPDIQ